MKILCLPPLLAIALGGCKRPPLAHEVALDAGGPADTGSTVDAGDRRAACRFDQNDSPSRVALAVAVDDSVVFVMTDGSAHTVHRFPSIIANTATLSVGIGIDQRGDRIVVTNSWWGDLGGSPCALDNGDLSCDETDRVVLVNVNGSVSWEKSFSRHTPSNQSGVAALLGDGGDVFVSGVEGGLLIAPDGGEQVASAPPIARPFSGPVMPIAATGRDLPGARFAWWRPGNLVAPTDLSIDDPLDPFDAGSERIFPATAGDGTRVVAHARPDRIETLPVPAEIGAGRATFSSGFWRGFELGGGVVRLNLLTGESARLDPSIPDGMRQIGAGMGDDGALLSVLRNDFMAGVFRWADAASGWTRIGKILGEVEQVTVRDVAGTYLVDAQGTNRFFVPAQTWQGAPTGQTPELLQTSYQIVRPVDGVDAEIDPILAPWLRVSSDGLCAAYWASTASGLQLTVHDLARDIRFSTSPATAAARLAAAVWIE